MVTAGRPPAAARILLGVVLLLGLPVEGVGQEADDGEWTVAGAQEMQATLARLRGLEFTSEVTIQVVTREELRQEQERELTVRYPPGHLERMQIAYRTLGLIPADLDLREGLRALLEEELAALQDEATGTLRVVAGIPRSALGEITLAHELGNALEDQHHDLRRRIAALRREPDEDREFALRSLIEGSAAYLSTLYRDEVGIAPLELMSQQMEQAGRQERALPPDLPAVLMRDSSLPYTRGQLLVQQLVREGGWEAVNRALADPPVSSEQVLHPVRLGTDWPRAIELQDLRGVLGSGWELVWENTLGEMRLAVLVDVLQGKREKLMATLLSSGTGPVASGWDGDRYAVYRRGGGSSTLLALITLWDSEKDARQLLDHYALHAGRRLPGARVVRRESHLRRWAVDERIAHIEQEEDRVILLEGAPAELADDLLTALASSPVRHHEREQGGGR